MYERQGVKVCVKEKESACALCVCLCVSVDVCVCVCVRETEREEFSPTHFHKFSFPLLECIFKNVPSLSSFFLLQGELLML